MVLNSIRGQKSDKREMVRAVKLETLPPLVSVRDLVGLFFSPAASLYRGFRPQPTVSQLSSRLAPTAIFSGPRMRVICM